MFNITFDIAIFEVMMKRRYADHFLVLITSGSIKQCVFWNVPRFKNNSKWGFFVVLLGLLNTQEDQGLRCL